MADDAGENAAVAAPCPQSCNRQHDGVVSAKPERRQSRKREETADDHGFGPDPIRQGSEQRLQQEFGDNASLEEYRYITATNFREVSEDYYKKGDNSLNAPRKEASKKR